MHRNEKIRIQESRDNIVQYQQAVEPINNMISQIYSMSSITMRAEPGETGNTTIAYDFTKEQQEIIDKAMEAIEYYQKIYLKKQ